MDAPFIVDREGGEQRFPRGEPRRAVFQAGLCSGCKTILAAAAKRLRYAGRLSGLHQPF
jgi:hypothetical protein